MIILIHLWVRQMRAEGVCAYLCFKESVRHHGKSPRMQPEELDSRHISATRQLWFTESFSSSVPVLSMHTPIRSTFVLQESHVHEDFILFICKLKELLYINSSVYLKGHILLTMALKNRGNLLCYSGSFIYLLNPILSYGSLFYFYFICIKIFQSPQFSALHMVGSINELHPFLDPCFYIIGYFYVIQIHSLKQTNIRKHNKHVCSSFSSTGLWCSLLWADHQNVLCVHIRKYVHGYVAIQMFAENMRSFFSFLSSKLWSSYLSLESTITYSVTGTLS